MALAFAPTQSTRIHRPSKRVRAPHPIHDLRRGVTYSGDRTIPLRLTFEEAGLYVDHAYRFTDDGYHIEEKATGRVFHRDHWATRGR